MYPVARHRNRQARHGAHVYMRTSSNATTLPSCSTLPSSKAMVSTSLEQPPIVLAVAVSSCLACLGYIRHSRRETRGAGSWLAHALSVARSLHPYWVACSTHATQPCWSLRVRLGACTRSSEMCMARASACPHNPTPAAPPPPRILSILPSIFHCCVLCTPEPVSSSLTISPRLPSSPPTFTPPPRSPPRPLPPSDRVRYPQHILTPHARRRASFGHCFGQRGIARNRRRQALPQDRVNRSDAVRDSQL